ncbi:DUF4232 domain-containing protein [Streptomyces sp. NPDC047085]|jgi:hypothetical protein|uniref:DUF4232 domain-containing protein n=1 Tax=Streptomyces sp. NPDC047085 TaxID=3155140 RepID=UPI0033DE8FE3
MARRTLAVSALGLAVLLGAAACGNDQGPADARPAACGTPQLSWKMVRLPGKPHKTPAATLSARNKGPKSCAFDGYPALSVYVGKGPSADAKPKKATPVHLVLDSGRTIEFPVFYDPIGAPGDCDVSAEYNPRVDVRPPHPAAHDYGSPVRLTDAKGHQVRAQVCGPDMLLGAPRLR